MTPATMEAPGFEVTKTDGATIFHRVPIFAECTRGELVFDAEWIAAAVAEAKAGERDGHLPPLHTRHHEPATDQTDAVQSAGVFRVLEAAPLSFKGKRLTAIYADLIVTDSHLADELGKMRYPYRSVEIFEPEGSPKINGLALLNHEAPYLELPMLMAGEVNDRTNDPSVAGVASATFAIDFSSQPTNPTLGSVRRDTRAFLLFKFPDEAETIMTEQQAPAELTDEEKAKAAEAAGNFADDDDKDAENQGAEDDGEGGIDVAAVASAIESGAISIADMDIILAAIQAQTSETTEEDSAEDVAPAPVPGAEIMKGRNGVNFARLEGENQALKARLDKRDADDKRNTDVAEALERLEGRPLGSDLKLRLATFHKRAKGDVVLFKEYVETMARTAGELADDDSAGAAFASQPKTPSVAMRFSSLGTDAVEKVAGFAREHQHGYRGRATEESYVTINMRRAGFELAAS